MSRRKPMTGPWSLRMLSQASADEVRHEEGCDDEEQEEISPGPALNAIQYTSGT